MLHCSVCGGEHTFCLGYRDDVVALFAKNLLDLHNYLPETGTIIASAIWAREAGNAS